MLGKVRIANGTETDTTAVSNQFIDAFLADANDAQIKIYLYLLRAMQAGRATSVPEIADAFNHTEREVKRALSYWEEKGLVRLEYDGKRLINIALEDLGGGKNTPGKADVRQPGAQTASVSAPVIKETDEPPETPSALPGKDTAPEKRRYSAAEMEAFRNDEALSMTLFAAEQYFRRALNPTETRMILYIYEELGFPADLLDYLLQYTVEHAKGRYVSYLEKTAIAWHGEGVRTLDDAKTRSAGTDRRAFEIMRALGLSANRPTPFETGYFDRWLTEYGFPMETVLEACRRTVFRVQSHRVEYADGILSDWHKKGAHTPEETAALDEHHARETHKTTEQKRPGNRPDETGVDTRNRFNRFRAQDYDFDALKTRIVSNN